MKTIFLIALFGILSCLYAQPPDALWTRRIVSSGNDQCNAVVSTILGHFLVGGSISASSNSAILVDDSGDILTSYMSWSMDADITAFARTESGTIISGGTDIVYTMHTWVPQATICRRNEEGRIESNCQYYLGPIQISAPGTSLSSDFALTPDGETILVGSAAVSTWGYNNDFWATRLNAGGDTLWNGGYDIAHDRTNAVVVTPDEGYLIVGSIADTADLPTDIALLRLNANGDSLWFRRFGGSGNDEACDVLVMPDGGFLIAGFMTGADDSPYASLLRTNASGDSLWQRTYGGVGSTFHALRESTSGGYVAAGYTSAYGHGGKDFLLFKIDANGDSIWSTTFGGAGDEICKALDITLDSGYVLAGTTDDSLGVDWWVVRTSMDLAAELPQPLPFTFTLHQNYPNPFNATTDIRFELAKASDVSLRIFDLNGREVATLINSNMRSGEHTVTWKAENTPSGLYFYQLAANGFSETKKMVLLK